MPWNCRKRKLLTVKLLEDRMAGNTGIVGALWHQFDTNLRAVSWVVSGQLTIISYLQPDGFTSDVKPSNPGRLQRAGESGLRTCPCHLAAQPGSSPIAKYRRVPIEPTENPTIGCILLAEPFFFRDAEWIPVLLDFSLNIVQGKGYDSEDGASGRALWEAVTERLATRATANSDPGPATIAAFESVRYGEPVLVRPRLGQGTFRMTVTDVYERRCTITGERTLPVLEAAHIKPYGVGGPHASENGLLLRSDLHTLFDQGYVTVDADQLKVVISNRIREEFENGRDYYQLHGRAIRLPRESNSVPSREYLAFHNSLFR